MQLLAKWNPSKYGDRLALAGTVETPVKLSLEESAREVAMLLATAAARKVEAQRALVSDVDPDANGRA